MSPVSNSPQALRLLGIIFPALGICFLGMGIWFGVATHSFLKRSVATTGTVIALTEVHTQENNDTRDSLAPVFQFSDANGSGYTVTSNTSSNPPAFRVGEIIAVRYDPADPAGAKIDSFGQLWLFPAVFAGVGSVFTVMGAGLFVRGRQSAR